MIEPGTEPGDGAPAPEIAVGALAPPQASAPAVAPPPALPATGAARVAQLMQLANQHEQAGRLAEADGILRLVVAETPQYHPAHHLLGIVAFKQGQIGEAARLIEHAIALAPMEALYYRNICEIYRIEGRFDEALTAGQRAASLAPNDVHCHHNLSVLHYHRLEPEAAIVTPNARSRSPPISRGRISVSPRPRCCRATLLAAGRSTSGAPSSPTHRRCCRRPIGRNGTACRSTAPSC